PPARRTEAGRAHQPVQPGGHCGAPCAGGARATCGDSAMNWIAWKMLTGDRAKYFGIVFGVAFGSLLISHQTSIFVSVLRRTASQIIGNADADLLVKNCAA